MIDLHRAGAKGDGKTDDTKAIQAAIDLAAEKGDSVFVPAGVFLTSRLVLRHHTGLVGNITYDWKKPGGSILQLIDPGVPCMIDLTQARGATLHGLCLVGDHLGTQVHGVLVDKPDYGLTEDNPRIERCQITRFSGDGVRLHRIWCYSVRSSMISMNRGNGLTVRGWDGFILDNWFSLNDGIGIASLEENNAATITANRIEWNKRGGISIRGGSHYNITGNYIDRSGGPAIRFEALPGVEHKPKTIVGNAGYSTITGNICYRSGKPEWAPIDAPDNCHVYLEGVRGLVVSANTLVVGRDDDNPGSTGFSKAPNWSPRQGIVYSKLANCIIKDNVMESAATQELLVDKGRHDGSVLVKDNLGSLFQP